MTTDTGRRAGEFHQVYSVTFRPTSRLPTGIPFWLAARWPSQAPIRRTAKYQGVVVIPLSDPTDVALVREQLSREGADLDPFEIAVWSGEIDATDAPTWDKAGATWLLCSSGPFHMRWSEIFEMVSAGPRR
jgi:hypothetical protein